MKLDTFNTLVEGHTVYKGKMSKAGQVLCYIALIGGVSALVYWKFIRVPKFVYINSDPKISRIQFRLDNNSKNTYYINSGQNLNIGKLSFTSTPIKQSDSELITGLILTEKSEGKIIKEQTISF